MLFRRRSGRLGDALIAQTSIERRISLITWDKDFRAFAETANLDLVV